MIKIRQALCRYDRSYLFMLGACISNSVPARVNDAIEEEVELMLRIHRDAPRYPGSAFERDMECWVHA